MATRRFGPYVVETSNEDKLLFPGAGITKGDIIDYYQRVAEYLIPHLEDRPLVVQRFPDGIEEEGFYQKQAPDHLPDWIETTTVELKTTGEEHRLIVCNNQATLVYLADQACLAVHPWLSRRDRLDAPDMLVVDLDPAVEGDFESVRWAALEVRDLLDELDMPSYAKLTGSRGVHAVVPLDRGEEFDGARQLARDAMDVLVRRHPDRLTTEQRKNERRGRLYLDVMRNGYGQTAVAPYSVRPLPGAPIAIPIDWAELERGALGPRDYSVANVARRLAQKDDPWEGLRRRARSLDPARERLQELRVAARATSR